MSKDATWHPYDAAIVRRRRRHADGRAHVTSDFLPRAPVGSFVRASGDCVCSQCGKAYRKHPDDPYEIDANGTAWLTVLCDGSRVKL